MQVILDSSFSRPGSAPIWGGKKGEFRDWTIDRSDCRPRTPKLIDKERKLYSRSALDSMFFFPLVAIFCWQIAMSRMYLNFVDRETQILLDL